jgi:hypothetical protein
MSDIALNPAPNDFLTDGDVPRLAEVRPIVPDRPIEPAFTDVDGGPTWALLSGLLDERTDDGAAPTLPSPRIDAVPVITALDGPSLPSALNPEPTEPKTAVEPGAHPMAHLMPTKSVATEASRRAAKARAAKKAKARKIKIGVAVGAIAVGAVVGPPAGKWLVNAINESGSTKTEQNP